jgi:hypothetical protein
MRPGVACIPILESGYSFRILHMPERVPSRNTWGQPNGGQVFIFYFLAIVLPWTTHRHQHMIGDLISSKALLVAKKTVALFS